MAEKLWEYTSDSGLKLDTEQNSDNAEKSNSLEDAEIMKKRKISNTEKSE